MDFSAVAAQLNAGILLPEFIMAGTLVVVLVTDLIVGRSATRWTPYVAIAGAVASAIALFFQWDAPNPISFLGSFNGDNLSVVFRGIVALSAALTVLMSVPYVIQSGTSMTEFISILLTASLGGMLLCGANELVSIFIALETLGISSYVLTGYMKRDARSNEAALKYLLIGASSTAIFLYSVSLLYGLSGGQTNLNEIALAMTDTTSLGGSIAVAISLVFAIAALFGRTAGAVPLNDENFRASRILALTVRQLARQGRDVERTLSARKLARLAGRLAIAVELAGLADTPPPAVHAPLHTPITPARCPHPHPHPNHHPHPHPNHPSTLSTQTSTAH